MICYTHYRPWFKIDKQDALSRCTGVEISGKDGYCFNEGQLWDLDNDHAEEEEDVEDMELEGSDRAT